MYPYLSTDSRLLGYSHVPYMYSTPAQYLPSYRPRPDSGSSWTLSKGEASDAGVSGVSGVSGGRLSGSGDVKTEALIKRDGEPVSMLMSGVDQSCLGGSPCAYAATGDAPRYKDNNVSEWTWVFFQFVSDYRLYSETLACPLF